MRIWLAVIAGMSAPGMMTTAPITAFCDALASTTWSQYARRTAGRRTASAAAPSPAARTMRFSRFGAPAWSPSRPRATSSSKTPAASIHSPYGASTRAMTWRPAPRTARTMGAMSTVAHPAATRTTMSQRPARRAFRGKSAGGRASRAALIPPRSSAAPADRARSTRVSSAPAPTTQRRATSASPARASVTALKIFDMLTLLDKAPPVARRDRGPQVDGLQQADEHQERDHGRAAVAQERQRDARHRHDTNRHADVHEHLEQKHDRDAPGEDAAVHVTRQRGDAQTTPDQDSVERDQQQRPEKPVALAEDGEDEVGVVLGQEVEGRLRGHVAAPRERPRADGDHRLDDGVTAAPGVVAGIEEDEQAVDLVLLDHVDPGHRQDLESDHESRHGAAAEHGEMRPRGAVEVEHGERESDHHHGRAEVRLLVDEEGRHRRHEQRDERDALGAEKVHAVGEVGADAEREQQHGESRRLETLEAEVDPAPGAVDDLAEGEDEGDAEHGERVHHPLEAAVDLVVEQRNDRGGHQPHDDGGQLLGHEVQRLPFDVMTRGEVDHRDAVGDEPERGGDEDVVQVPEVGAPVHAQSLLTAPLTFSLFILKRAS